MKISFPYVNQKKVTLQTGKVKFSSVPAFKGAGELNADTFDCSKTVCIQDVRGGTIRGTVVKNVTFDDKKGGKVPGMIIKDANKKNQFFAAANGKNQCRMVIEEDEDGIFVDELYGNNNHGEVKGAGTELLKLASEISTKKGYNGRLSLQMAGSFPFYYKNNFRVADRYINSAKMNAALDYMTRTGTDKKKVWRCEWSTPIAELDDIGAKALVEGKRLSDKSKSKILYSVNGRINGEGFNYDMDFCDLDDKFVLQMIDKDAKCYAQLAYLEGEIKNGELIPKDKIEEIYIEDKNGEISREFFEALKLAQQHYSDTQNR